MKRKIENYLNSKDKNEYSNLDKIFELYLSGDIKKLLSKYAGVGVYPTMNKLGKTIQLNYNYHNHNILHNTFCLTYLFLFFPYRHLLTFLLLY